ncbi:N-acyl-phosphatidylethanolamine-hydrolysing phospholipase D [Entomortierella parvispora]|uniref:N-acyl-phosphatidylethanolamine-hydrolysing phospholipase D n=1 Tax=Entomortierella parvispora TaxID=205924 RepID=A0A9P3HHB2_9FUNG|nr:N-acyl-phosphatidylethanolamine-hydrolysing phospholipase D [Entomortierella parvispora]
MVFEFDRKKAKPSDPNGLPKILPINKDDLTLFSQPKKETDGTDGRHAKVTSTWLGHACFLVQVEGVNILFDPVFSERCSPSQLAGPKRITPPPCKLDELPRVDIVVISHNHYDHLDLTTIKNLQKDHQPYFYVPLGNKAWFDSIGIKDKVTECDWWDSHDLSFHDDKTGVKVVCTPCQHFTGRSLTDRYKTLWASWVIETIPKNVSEKPIKVFFGGDTGYRYVPNGRDEDDMPHCPAFKEIGERIGPFDFSMIPIGAYSPRWFMSPIHCSPEDAVRVHEDIKSKRSVGMHWGTWVLTDEDVTEPPRRLEAAMKKRGHDPKIFDVMQIGETLTVDVQEQGKL